MPLQEPLKGCANKLTEAYVKKKGQLSLLSVTIFIPDKIPFKVADSLYISQDFIFGKVLSADDQPKNTHLCVCEKDNTI